MLAQMIAQSSSVITNALTSGEQLLWSGQPRGGLRLLPSDILAIPFSIMWAGFAFFWEWTVVNSGAPLFFRLWGIPFVLVGIYILVGRFWYDALMRDSTWYGLTNERVIIVTTLFGQNRKSLALSEMPDITLSLNGDRSGTITFGEPPPWYSVGGSFFRRTPAAPSLDTIKEAQDVYELIRTAQRAAA